MTKNLRIYTIAIKHWLCGDNWHDAKWFAEQLVNGFRKHSADNGGEGRKMIAIINEGGPVLGVCRYRLQINDQVVCRFDHDRTNGLAQCLIDAAAAVESKKWKDMAAFLEAAKKD